MLLLRSLPVQWAGGASYSIYLWHWPLIVVAPFVIGAPLGTVAKLVIFALSLVLGGLSRRFIEDPARRSRALNHRLWLTYGVGALVIALVAVGSTAVTAVAVQQGTYAQHVARDTVNAALDNGNPCFGAAAMTSGASCPASHLLAAGFGPDIAADDWGTFAGVTKDGNLPPSVKCVDFSPDHEGYEECTLGNLTGTRTVAIVGDSHALALLEPLVRIAEQQGWKVKSFLRNSCSPSLPIGAANPAVAANCDQWRQLMAARISADSSIDTVIATGFTRGESGFTGTRAELDAGFSGLWSEWASKGKRVYIIGDVPATSGQSVPECVAAHPSVADPCSEPRSIALAYDPLQSSVALAHSSRVSYIDLTNEFCDAKICHAVIGGIIAYRDSHHLTGTFALTLVPSLRKGLGLPATS